MGQCVGHIAWMELNLYGVGCRRWGRRRLWSHIRPMKTAGATCPKVRFSCGAKLTGNHVTKLYLENRIDTMRDTILTCAQKLTYVSLIGRKMAVNAKYSILVVQSIKCNV